MDPTVQATVTPTPERPPEATAQTPPSGWAAGADRMLATLRIALGLVFAWAFLDKLFGLGYSTPGARAWINGGSPTRGFLGSIDQGPFASMFRGMAGTWWADWLFMLGLLGLGAALVLGIGLRVAAVGGTILMAMMWLAEWPPAKINNAGEPTGSTNPFIDYHVIYALVMITMAMTLAGHRWGLGRRWAELGIVQRNRWLL
ncbi:DoxX family membrane protein [Actinophytocola sp.]|uniref:DoxX family membrane protein n=1 Tax=Actinophytocola sp. TaxID=1872138 RepID=UPI0039C8A827